jgi:hypothetical protein
MAGYGVAMAGFGRLWQAMGWLWQALAGLSRLWQAMAGFGRLWVGVDRAQSFKNKSNLLARWEAGPLQFDMTSSPMTCQMQRQNQDTLLLVLYGDNTELVDGLIHLFATNILQSNHSAGHEFQQTVQTIVASRTQGLDYARAVLLLLLNVDEIGKEWVCKGFPNAKIGSLCGHKAPGFFTALAQEVVPSFQRNEANSVQQLVLSARSAYLVA